MAHVVWVEIPVKDLERAMKFYQAVFELPPVQISDEGVRRTATLFGTGADGNPGFSLNQTSNFEPGSSGPFIYLDAGEELSAHLSRVEPAGGKIVAHKTSMGSAGNFASILDTEGNLIGLYSPT